MFIELVSAIIIAAKASAGILLLILSKSILDFSRTGPQIRAEITKHFRYYLIYAVFRLVFLGWLISFFWFSLGATLYLGFISLTAAPYHEAACGLVGLVALGMAAILNFSDQLLHKPSNICVSWQYRMSRLYALWRYLSPGRIRLAWWLFGGGIGTLLIVGILSTGRRGEWGRLLMHLLIISLILGYLEWRRRVLALPPARSMDAVDGRPNIVMIGSDTLRVDHIGAMGYARPTTPFLDRLIQKGTFFQRCYTPLARTAPSLASLFTGVWPHQHLIRDNYVGTSFDKLPAADTLAEVLSRHGYRSAAISDWCGSDLKKLRFGFDEVEAPDDQWNLKYYLRQGPMLLRLFLSLFVNNPIGRIFVPEIFYQAGNPLETYLGIRACQKIYELGGSGQPFFLNVFMASTHAPFGSEYPYYLKYSDRNYAGESKFVMTSFRDPNDIIEKQELTPDKFDLDQILRLYDGCVSKFDAEVARIAGYLEECGLADNTLLVIYSDHGIEFFENQSWGQGNTVLGDDFGARIPLLIYDPRQPGKGIVGQITRSIDLAPTLLELCGIEPPASMYGISLVAVLRDGVDLDLMAYQETGIWLGKIPGRHPDHLTYPNLLELLEIPDKKTGTLAIKQEFLPLLNQAKDRMLRKGPWKLVYQPLWHGALCQLFNMDADPACGRDVAAEYPEIFEAMKLALIPWLRADAISTDFPVTERKGLRLHA
jgi:arylsulfatase A-like enzyme